MTRSLYAQPTTNNVNNLVIGKPAFFVRKIDNATAFGDTQADVTTSPLTVANTVGAIQSGTLSAEVTTKIHSSTFPALEDARINEAIDVIAEISLEELGSTMSQSLLQSILDRVAGGSADRWAVEVLTEKVNGGGVSFYLNHTQLVPELTLTSQNDWIGATLKFRSLDRSSYTNRSFIYRLPYSGSARSLLKQPQTVDPNSLAIGFAQVRIGAQTPRPTTGGNGMVFKSRFYPASGSTTLYSEAASNSGLNYTGSLDGGFQVVITKVPYRIDGSQTGATFDTSVATGDNTLGITFDIIGAVPVTFSDTATNPIATVVSEINSAAGATVAFAGSDNHVYLVSPTGPGGSVEITEANTSLGFVVAAALTADKFTVTAPDGEVIATDTTITGAAQALDDGATITFGKTVDYFLGDTYIVGVETGDAKLAVPAATGIWSRHSYLRHSHSVGALQAATLSISASLKQHNAGYPSRMDAEIAESVEIVTDVSAEEYAFASGALVSGEASTVSDMVFDSAVNGVSYFAPVEFVLQQYNGNVLTFWMPNCRISGQLTISPGDDWAILPFQLAAQKQNDANMATGATAPNQVIMLTHDKYDVT